MAISTSRTVTSADGTAIAYECVGDGPALILVDGACGFRNFGSSPELARLLAPTCRVYAYDRRGRGESGDTQPFSLDREIEDIDALITEAGGSASLYGISSGGALALEAAAKLGDRVENLAVYEIPYDSTEAGINAYHAYRSSLTRLLAEGQRGDAVELFMRFVGASDEGVQGMRQSPVWSVFESVAPTLRYDAAALGDDRVVPTGRAAKVTAGSLVMDGGDSREKMPFMYASAEELAAVIPHAERCTLEGQWHDVDINVLAPVLAEFVAGGR
jgi:pimeloyl-ACP methyl ester carboxylesterase